VTTNDNGHVDGSTATALAAGAGTDPDRPEPGIRCVMLRFLAAAAFAALTLFAVPATADAKTLRGKTSQGHRVTLTVGADGVPTRLTIRWTGPCKKSSVPARSTSRFVPAFDQATADTLQDADTRRTRYRGGLRVRNSAEISGQRSGETWSGTFSQRRLFSRRGKVFDVCEAKGVTWSVA
jgi:hypothetical protein